MTDPIERIAVALEAFDQRLSAIDTRFVRVEGHLADDAQATEETAVAIAKMADSVSRMAVSLEKLQELYVALDEKTDQHVAVMQNFITETQRLRTSSQQLISEIRRKGA